MTAPAFNLMLYLDRVLMLRPALRADLAKLYARRTGRELDPNDVWRHGKRRVEPRLGVSLVYLELLHHAGELLPAKKRGDLFRYRRPELLGKNWKPKKKRPRKVKVIAKITHAGFSANQRDVGHVQS